MPEFGIGRAECPAKSVQSDSRLNMTVLCDVNDIIIDEVILINLPENSKSNDNQNEINDQFLSLGTNIYFI